jgi:hypothetical protein
VHDEKAEPFAIRKIESGKKSIDENSYEILKNIFLGFGLFVMTRTNCKCYKLVGVLTKIIFKLLLISFEPHHNPHIKIDITMEITKIHCITVNRRNLTGVVA